MYRKDTEAIHNWIKKRISVEEMGKIMGKYPEYEDVDLFDGKFDIEIKILMLIGRWGSDI